MGDQYVRQLVSITPSVSLSSRKRESRQTKKRHWECSRPLKHTCWQIL
ncbi:hypothetical protein Golax_022836, partial [Gossypium laxum]|nr:hypothetical protein [Gossypium laxum]